MANLLRHRLVVGISGASCSGKTTLTKLLNATFPWASVVHQDAYYHPNDPKLHVYLPDVNHFNWDVKSAVDFVRMEKDIQKLLMLQECPNKAHLFGKEDNLELYISKSNEQLLCCPNEDFVRNHKPPIKQVNELISRFSDIPLTLIEGHIIFNHSPFYNLCDLKYFLTLDQSELYTRRRKRIYDPPNPPGYLEKYVWPAYLRRLEEAKQLPGITYFDAKGIPLLAMYREISEAVALEMENLIMPQKRIPATNSISSNESSGSTSKQDIELNRRMTG